MVNEKQKAQSQNNLTRGEKLTRRLAPSVVLLGGAAAAFAMNASTDTEPHSDSPEQTVVHAVVTGEFSEGVTPQETAMDLMSMAIENAAYKGFTELGVSEDTDVLEIVKEVPIYNQAAKALEEAGYGDEVLPDANDKLKLGIDVTIGEDKSVSVDVTDVEIIDIPNNQE